MEYGTLIYMLLDDGKTAGIWLLGRTIGSRCNARLSSGNATLLFTANVLWKDCFLVLRLAATEYFAVVMRPAPRHLNAFALAFVQLLAAVLLPCTHPYH